MDNTSSRLMGRLFKGLNVVLNCYQKSKEQVKHSPKEINNYTNLDPFSAVVP